jgi:hypothetical protein
VFFFEARAMTNRDDQSALWAARIESWKASGLKQLAFCRREGIGYDSFKRWRHRLDGEAVQRRGARATLVPLKVVARSSRKRTDGGSMEVRLNGDRRIVVGADFDEAALRRLIGALERLGC